MNDRFQDKYRISSARLQNWDYGSKGAYFVTLCTQKNDCLFGNIYHDKMILSEVGKISLAQWNNIHDHFPYAKQDVFVVMPNHVHGIIIINNTENQFSTDCRDAIYRVSDNRVSDINVSDDQQKDAINRVSTDALKQCGGITGDKNPMLHNNLSRIIRWYKGRVSFESHPVDPCFDWQPGLYDHIIRNEQSYLFISNYIINNPKNWEDDKLYIK